MRLGEGNPSTGEVKEWVTNVGQTDDIVDPCLKFPCFPNESPPKVLQREQHEVESSKGRRNCLNFACCEKGYPVLNHLYKKKMEIFSSRKQRKHIEESFLTSQAFSANWRWRERKEVIAQGSNTSPVMCCWKSWDWKGNLSIFISRLGLHKQQ